MLCVTTATSTYTEVFASGQFRVLFTSRTIAIAATTLRMVALSLLVFSMTGSPLLSAIAFGIGFLPQAAGGMLFGSLADRIKPRPLITMGYAIEGAAAVVLAIAPLPVWASLALVGAVAAATPIFNGASSRLVADVLHGDAYVLGRSTFNMAAGGAQLLGLAAGGIAVAALGPQRALLVTAVCHFAAAGIARAGLSDHDVAGDTGERSAMRQSWHTNALLLRDTWVRRLLLIQWLPNAFAVGAEALIVAYAAMRGFPVSATGFLLACSPAGMLIGYFVIGRFVKPDMRTTLVGPLICVLGLPLAVVALDPPLAIAGLLFAISGAGMAYPLGLQTAFLEAVPEVNRGQAFGLLSTGLMTLQGIGPVVFGGLAQVTHLRWAIAVSGVATVTSALLVAGQSGKPTLHATHADTPRT
ncbi:MFS transporter [Catelliglobosispora koreensis]|uniref:MFS transporter n=1 Tax=Catelliglobosispora koreensis TaxID=129052 RepID=UPI0003600931